MATDSKEQQAQKRAEWERKAESEWSSVVKEKGPQADLKTLLVDVKSALKKKQEANKKLSKKATKAIKAKQQSEKLMQRVAEASVEAATSPKEERVDRMALDYQIEVTKKIEALKTSIRLATASIDVINDTTVKSLKTDLSEVQSAIKSGPEGLDKDTLNATVKDMAIEVAQLSIVAKENSKVSKETVKETQKARTKKQTEKPPAERPGFMNSLAAERKKLDDFNQGFMGPRNHSPLQRAADKARSLVGGIRSGAYKEAAMKGAGTVAGQVINYFQAPNSPLAVKALGSLAKGAWFTGRAVTTAASDTMKWMGKRLSTIARFLGRFLRDPVSSGLGGLGSLLGAGVFAASILKPVWEGIDKELKTRFGDNYVEDFVSGLWDKAWSYLVKQIKSFLGITESTATPISDAGNAHDTGAESRAIMEAATPSTPLTPAQKVTKEKALQEYRDTLEKGSFMQKFYQVGLNAEQKAAKARYEAALKGELTLNDNSSSSTTTATTVTSTAGAGRGSTFPNPPSQSTSAAPSSPTAVPVPSAPVQAVGKSSAVAPPMEGPKTAVPPPPAPRMAPTSSSSSSPTSSSGMSPAAQSALGVAQVPLFASSDSMNALNLGVIG